MLTHGLLSREVSFKVQKWPLIRRFGQIRALSTDIQLFDNDVFNLDFRGKHRHGEDGPTKSKVSSNVKCRFARPMT
jgi:hypothetical protein